MAISSLNDYIASEKQICLFKKTASATSVNQTLTSIFNLAGLPGAGVLAGTSTTAGVVPADDTAGFPPINTFTGTKGYISRCSAFNTVACGISIVDVLWKGGAYPFNSAVTLSAQPSFSSRVPNGTDFSGLEIWLEQVTSMTGNQTIAVTYTNQSGVTGRTTGAIATGVAPIVARCLRLPFQSGDSGVQKIESVTSTISSAGTFNVLIVRPLAYFRIPVTGYAEVRDLYGTGLPQIYADSAIAVYVKPDSTSTGLPEVEFEVANL